ncbi:predicted protein [Uncinocarpus reesii 1704]|uniref:Uncharacterized protein n=1 Tax=Uncinocarpus reesii (strain UAMH 1704) TaxID=336963 RepID=C4JRA4_UNCRE|nr:uncharacterized protein UREG_04993 [Uncinocarpus reesii 1704]EEP80151.1 predicted protein [Uncinocarpus reesii 1704]
MPRSSFVDLTTLSSSPATNDRDEIRRLTGSYSSMPNPSSFHVSEDSHDSKRRRLNSDAAAGPSALTSSAPLTPQEDYATETPDVDAIDLTDVNDPSSLAHALSKQQEDAVKAQHSANDETGRSTLTSYKCPVCMDTPVDATTTICDAHMKLVKRHAGTVQFAEKFLPGPTVPVPGGI